MKISLALLLVLVLLLAGCVYQQAGECGKFAMTTSTNVTINNSVDAFDNIKKQLELGTSYTYSGTLNATLNKLKYENLTLANGAILEIWVLNNDVAIDKNGNMFVRLTCP